MLLLAPLVCMDHFQSRHQLISYPILSYPPPTHKRHHLHRPAPPVPAPQVATSTGVFLFDLVALFSRRANLDVFPRFDATMEALLSNPRIVKLGFSFKQDAAALRKACPEVRGFRQIEPLLEVGGIFLPCN